MPDGHSDPPTRSAIYRQLIVMLPGKGPLGKEREELYKVLHGLARQVDSIKELRAELIALEDDADADAIVARLLEARVASAVEQNRVLHGAGVVNAPVVNDPRYAEQWTLGRIDAESAWRRARSIVDPQAPGVVVAVIDTGIRSAHPDLVNHLWDDGSGGNGLNLIDGGSDVFDGDGHGTRLAGTIGALSNDGVGMAAAEWPVRLMAVKFIDVSTPPTAWKGAAAIVHALLRGAQIINTAWGVGVSSSILQAAIGLAADWEGGVLGVPGVLVVAAAGNDGLDNDVLPTYPASYPNLTNLVSVMASDRDDDKPGFSNYGRTTVHLAAPGVRVLTTDTYLGTPRWREYSGTSAACAQVTYAAALIKTMNPSWRPGQIRDHLMASVDHNRWLKCIAQGRLNLGRAVLGPFAITSPDEGDVWATGSDAFVTWTDSYVTGEPTTTVTLELSRNGGPYTPLAAAQPNNGSCVVVAPAAAVTEARLRIRSDQASSFYAESGMFKVQ